MPEGLLIKWGVHFGALDRVHLRGLDLITCPYSFLCTQVDYSDGNQLMESVLSFGVLLFLEVYSRKNMGLENLGRRRDHYH